MHCNQCGNGLSATAKFCGKCGEVVTPPAGRSSCPQCGGDCKAGAKFCGKCGFSIPTSPTSPTPTAPNASSVEVRSSSPDERSVALTRNPVTAPASTEPLAERVRPNTGEAAVKPRAGTGSVAKLWLPIAGISMLALTAAAWWWTSSSTSPRGTDTSQAPATLTVPAQPSTQAEPPASSTLVPLAPTATATAATAATAESAPVPAPVLAQTLDTPGQPAEATSPPTAESQSPGPVEEPSAPTAKPATSTTPAPARPSGPTKQEAKALSKANKALDDALKNF
ncbi:zinc ribbon domain-containing protein [Variovorax saccharolyticus]|uniref:zinc ribbon domain-containing protein n=1 Tax=Variovorax saccharolyticus TaxID=3053516 RepID=UPI003369C338